MRTEGSVQEGWESHTPEVCGQEQSSSAEGSCLCVVCSETVLMQRDTFFFFIQEDLRLAGGAPLPRKLPSAPPVLTLILFSPLTEGPRLFCCSPHLEEQKEQWEERRSSLRNVRIALRSTWRWEDFSSEGLLSCWFRRNTARNTRKPGGS